jgi:hypothetical protein
MAQNMGFGSAVTGFGTGYLNALRQGRSEQNSLLNAKLRKDALQKWHGNKEELLDPEPGLPDDKPCLGLF